MAARCTMEIDAGTALVELDSPENANALSPELVAELSGHLASAETDERVRVVVLASKGRVFCSGLDLKAPRPDGPLSGVALPELLAQILELSKPVVAAVDGAARGGGLGLVAAADIALATSKAHFAFSEVRLGVTPAIIATVCARRMTPRSLSRYMLTGEVFGAEAAAACGLVTLSVGDDLESRLSEVRAAFGLAEPGAVASTKRLLAAVPGMGLREGFEFTGLLSERAFSSPAAAEGMRAFAEHRPPSWSR